MINSVNLANKAIEKSINFLKSIKDQTREMKSNEGVRFNVIEIINDTLLLLSHSLKRKNLSVIFNYEKNPVELFGHPGKMAQIITNLITNASDAMENKKGENIEIDLVETENGIILRVSDKGCGITEENIKKIFEPLFTTKPFGMGTGLGLSIVHDIVYDEFKGIIEVESTLNIGTTFRILFKKPSKEDKPAVTY
jgi:signal transduction histidine kinase